MGRRGMGCSRRDQRGCSLSGRLQHSTTNSSGRRAPRSGSPTSASRTSAGVAGGGGLNSGCACMMGLGGLVATTRAKSSAYASVSSGWVGSRVSWIGLRAWCQRCRAAGQGSERSVRDGAAPRSQEPGNWWLGACAARRQDRAGQQASKQGDNTAQHRPAHPPAPRAARPHRGPPGPALRRAHPNQLHRGPAPSAHQAQHRPAHPPAPRAARPHRGPPGPALRRAHTSITSSMDRWLERW